MKVVLRLLFISTALATFACKGSTAQANPTASSNGSSGTSQSAGPTTHMEKNGGRDAAIGAGSGAILGAVTSKDKVKGGVIGAAAGGILGAVVGNNVDTKRVQNP